MKSIAIVVLALGLGAFVAGAADGEDKPKGPKLSDWAKQFDKNGDGKLDQEERAAATKARRDEMLKKYDKNGDGKLDPEEQKAMNEQRRQEAAARKAELEKGGQKKEEKKEEKKDK